MVNLTKASTELYRRRPDERFSSLEALMNHCRRQKDESKEVWSAPDDLAPVIEDGALAIEVAGGDRHSLNSWSFSQLCNLSGISRDTVNKLTVNTARQVMDETLPKGTKPFQLFADSSAMRSLHGSSYTRLFNADLLATMQEYAVDFEPPTTRSNEEVPLYCGEQDMFVFLIDPTGWIEIEGQAFAPGFFLWNSEVGRRTVGIQSFWFQAVCQNHIVWDAVEVVEVSQRHTGKVQEFLPNLERILAQLVEKRDARKDAFSKVIAKAMKEKVGSAEEDVLKLLSSHGISKSVALEAKELAKREGRFTIFTLVDALTRIAGRMKNAGERMEVDMKAAKLLEAVV
jgi:hypothetical protein